MQTWGDVMVQDTLHAVYLKLTLVVKTQQGAVTELLYSNQSPR